MSEKGSRQFASKHMTLGVAWDVGSREPMQDSFSLRLSNSDSDVEFFGVFDGHGSNGENIARFVAFNLYDIVINQGPQQGAGFAEAIKNGCLVLDEMMREVPELKDEGEAAAVQGGSSCCALFIKNRQIFSTNIGDSKFVLSYNGKAIGVSKVHRPDKFYENLRVVKAGGWVTDDPRHLINGTHEFARAFGDFQFKMHPKKGPHQQLVSVVPDVCVVDIDDSIDFLVVASAPLWNRMSNQEVCNYVIRRMAKFSALKDICRDLIEECKVAADPATGLGSDNLTIFIAILK